MPRIIDRPRRRALLDCVRVATAAPSLHNSQPWRFRVLGGMVEVHADPERRLHVLDPHGREQLISVGAAVFTLRLAIRQAGYRCDLTLFPEPAERDLVARVTVAHASAPTPSVRGLASAIARRHTNRSPFTDTPVAAEILDELRSAARQEGAYLAVAHPSGREAIMGMAHSADRWLRHRPGYHRELARWTGHGPDGVPIWAAGPVPAIPAPPLRDFGELSTVVRPGATFEPEPALLVLATRGDQWLDWVRAGQALQRVLLTATWRGLATMPISQPVEVPGIRRVLLDPSSGLYVQMVLRVGHGRAAEATPRRPLDDVLLPSPVDSRRD